MNDFTPLSDEALSAYLDGEATPNEVARIEADPNLQAELASMRAVATDIRDFDLPSDDVLFGLRTNAINSAAPAQSAVVNLSHERDKRRGRLAKFSAAIAVAAAVVVAALVVPNLNTNDTHTVASEDTSAESADEATADADMADTNTADADTADTDTADADMAEAEVEYATDDETAFDVTQAQPYGDDVNESQPVELDEDAIADEVGPVTGVDDESTASSLVLLRATYLYPDVIEDLGEATADKVAEQLALLGEPILFQRADDLVESVDEIDLNEFYVCTSAVAALRADGDFVGGGTLINDDSAEVEYVIQRNAEGVVQVVSFIAPECVANPIAIDQ